MRRKIKVPVLLLVVVSLFILIFSACSKDKTNTSVEGTSGDSVNKEKIKIKFSSFQSGDVAKDWEEQRFKDFERETGIQVEHVFIKHVDTISTLMTWVAAGTAPDAAMLSANYQNSLAAKGVLVNLSEYMEKNNIDYDISRYFDKLLDAYKYKGDLYALPSDLDLGLLWYNKDLFDEAGVAYPNENWTWDDYLEAAKALTKGEGPAKIFGTEFPREMFFLWQNGADIINADRTECIINSPEAIEALKFLVDMVNKYQVAPKPGGGEQLFQNGKAAMSYAGPWYAHYELKDVKFRWGVAPLPKGKYKVTTAYGSSFGILSASKNQDAAWEFIKWFLSDEQQFIRAQKFCWFPPALTVTKMSEFMNDDSVMNLTKEQKELVIKEVEYGRAPIVVEKQNEVKQIIDRELSLVWAGEKSVEEAVQIIKNEVDSLLK